MLVWNSVISTFKTSSDLREMARDEMTSAISMLRMVAMGRSIWMFLLQISEMASLKNMTATSVCSSREWVDRLEL
jgi:hypothetical protein